MSNDNGMIQPTTPAAKNGQWNDARDGHLRVMWNAGLTTLQMAEALSTTKNAIIGRARRIGCPARQSPIIVSGARPHIRQPSQKRKHVSPVKLPTLLELMGIPKPPPVPAPPMPIPAVGQATDAPTLFVVLSPRPCQWPMWTGRTPKQPLFCGAPVRIRADGVPCWTCPDHAKIAFTHAVSSQHADYSMRRLSAVA